MINQPSVRKSPPLPPHLMRLMPLKGEAGMRRVANGGTLFIDFEHRQDPKVPCVFFAKHFVHAAQDGGFGQICILKSPTHKHYFGVIDLVRAYRKWSGPSLFGFKIRQDCWMDGRKKLWVIGWKPNPNVKILIARN